MSKLTVVKVTCPSGKVVLLREMNIGDSETAAEMVAQRAGDNQILMGMFMQKALLQILLVQVDGKKLSGPEKQNINSMFKMNDYTYLLKVIGKLMGSDEGKQEVKMEMVAEE